MIFAENKCSYNIIEHFKEIRTFVFIVMRKPLNMIADFSPEHFAKLEKFLKNKKFSNEQRKSLSFLTPEIVKNVESKLNILVVLHHPSRKMRTTIIDHLYCFEKYSTHNVYYLNTFYSTELADEIKDLEFDLIIFHTIFLSHRWETKEFTELIHSDKLKTLKESNSVKIALPQDEWIYTNVLCDFINIFGVSHVFSVSPKSEWKIIYNNVDFNYVKFHEVLTGYLENSRVDRINNLADKVKTRIIDIGYRARGGRAWLGKQGYIKGEIAEIFKNATLGTKISTDISIAENDVFLGDAWSRFMLLCKYFIGVEGGSSVIDRDGEIRRKVEFYESQHPGASFLEIREACYPAQDGNLKLFALSPRQLEACSTRTCQILMEGDYNGILKPGVHYIELKKDYCNLNEVLKIVEDDNLREKITDNAYKDIVESGKYSYENFVQYVLSESLLDRKVSVSKTDLFNPDFLEKVSAAIIEFEKPGFEDISEELFDLKSKIQGSLEKKYYKIFSKHFKSGDYLSAKSSSFNLSKIFPDNPKYISIYASIISKLGDGSEALPLLFKAKKNAPNYPDTYLVLAQIYFDEQKYYVSESYIREFLELLPENVYGLNLLRSILMVTGRYSAASECCTKLLQISPNDYYALISLAKIERLSSNYAKSYEYIQRAFKVKMDEDAWYELALYSKQVYDSNLYRAANAELFKIKPEMSLPFDTSFTEMQKEKIDIVSSSDAQVHNTILLLYHHPLSNNAANILEHLNAFQDYSQFNVIKINTGLGFPEKLRHMQFPVIILHYSLFGTYPYPMSDEFKMFIGESKKSFKIVFFQDEYYYCRQRFDFINQYKIDCVFSLLEPENFKLVYEKHTNVSDIKTNLTGYVSDNLIELSKRITKPFNKRKIDIGYRTRQLPFYMGKGAQEKHLIAENFQKAVAGYNLKLDIETQENKRIYGGSWFQYVANCKAMLGVEAGVSVYDLNGEVRMKMDRYLEDFPDSGFDEAYEEILKPYEDAVYYRTLSPRHFEAAAFKVVQILFEGNYNGILKPMQHYIPLKKDFSNIKQVMEIFQDEKFRKQIVESSFEDLILSGKYSYQKFSQKFDDYLKSKGFFPDKDSKFKFQKGFNIELEPPQRTENKISNNNNEVIASLQDEINYRLGKISRMYHTESESIKSIIIRHLPTILHKFKTKFDYQLILSFLDERIELLNFHNYIFGREKIIPEYNNEKSRLINKSEELLISVCIYTYNRSAYLGESIKSVLNQTHKNYEIIIVDDGSTENNKEVIEQIGSPKIRYYKNDSNMGRPFARNRCIKESQGSYILWLGDDDILQENILQEYVAILNDKPDTDVIYCNIQAFDNETGENFQIFSAEDYTSTNDRILENLVRGSGITDGGSLIRKSLYEEYGYYNEEYLRAQDNEFWSRIATKTKFYKLNKIRYYYRKHKSNASFGDFIDHTYESKTIRRILNKNVLNKIFVNLDWNNHKDSFNEALYIAAVGLFNFKDYYNTSLYLEKLDLTDNDTAFELLFQCYLRMGDNINARNLLKLGAQKYNIEVERISKLNDTLNGYKKVIEKIIELADNDKFSEIENLIKILSENLFETSETQELLGRAYPTDKELSYNYYASAVRCNPKNEELFVDATKIARSIGKDKQLTDMRNRLLEEIPLYEYKISEKQKSNSDSIPIVSVIIPTHNRPELLQKAINSVLKQTYKSFEILVINDAGEDVAGLINSFNDPRIKYFVNDINRGPSASRNIGIKNSRGRYIAFLDDDDLLYKNHLKTLIETQKKINTAVVYSDAYRVLIDKVTNQVIDKKVIYSLDFDRNYLLIHNIATVQSFLIDKHIVKDDLLFDETFSTHEDWEFWLRLSTKYSFYHLPVVTSEYKHFNDDSNVSLSKLEEMLNTMKIIYNKYKIEPKLEKYRLATMKDLENRINSSDIVVSIVVPLFNQINYTRKLIECFENIQFPFQYELILVNNGSNDETAAYLDSLDKEKSNIVRIDNPKNLGFAKANNQGVAKARGRYFLFLNNDVEFDRDFVSELLKIIQHDPKVGAVGSKLLYSDNKIQHAGIAILNHKKFNDPLLASNMFVNESKDLDKANISLEYQAVTAACMLVRKNVFEEAGGFDEEYWNGYEDVDLCFNIREKGYKIIYQPKSVLIHHESKSGAERFNKATENISRLHSKWIDKIIPDFIIEANGDMIITENNQIKEYNLLSKGKDMIYDVSIITPLFNELSFTKEFIASVAKSGAEKFEFIFIDNASTDGTVEFLKELSRENTNVKVVFNNENYGFPIAVNQGIKISSGRYIVIANNDILVTDGWLERMISVAESDDKIGIVGPISNRVSGVQYDKNATYTTIPEMYKYAKKVSKKNKGKMEEFPRVAFLCTLIKKEVIEKIGGLDERFTPGNLEDDDFCFRAQLAGYKTIIAEDVFIHHYGSASFGKKGEDEYLSLIEKNRQKYINKWGADPEEIWLKGKQYNRRKLMYAINEDTFVEGLQRGLQHLEDNETESAIVELNRALNHFDNSSRAGYENVSKADLLNLLGNSSNILCDHQKAQEYFSAELELDPQSSRACQGLGETFTAAEMYPEAKQMFEWAIVNDDSNNKASEQLKLVNKILELPENDFSIDGAEQNDSVEQNEDYDKNKTENVLSEILSAVYELFSMKEYGKAIEILETNEKLFYSLYDENSDNQIISAYENLKGLNHLSRNETKEAQVCFENALQLNPVSAQACAGLGEVFYLEANDKESKTMYEWAVKNDPENNFALEGLKKVNLQLGFSPEDNSLDNDLIESLKANFEVFFKSAIESLENKEFAQAAANLLGALEIYDSSEKGEFNEITKPDIINLLGNTYLIIGDLQSAEEYFAKELELDPTSSRACYGLGEVFNSAQLFDEAKQMLEWAVKNDENNTKAIDLLFNVNLALGLPADNFSLDQPKENDENEEILKDKTQNILSEFLTVVYELFTLKEFDKAIEALEQNKELFYKQYKEESDNDIISAYENLKGLNYLAKNDTTNARESFETALQLNPLSSQACAGLGEVFYLEANDYEAKSMYELAVKNDPNNQFAVEGLRKTNSQLELVVDNN